MSTLKGIQKRVKKKSCPSASRVSRARVLCCPRQSNRSIFFPSSVSSCRVPPPLVTQLPNSYTNNKRPMPPCCPPARLPARPHSSESGFWNASLCCCYYCPLLLFHWYSQIEICTWPCIIYHTSTLTSWYHLFLRSINKDNKTWIEF